MKRLLEEWGCLVLIVTAVAAFFFFSATKKPRTVGAEPKLEAPVHVAPPLTFGGYACTEDCSGHEAGYQWAEEQGISNPDDCGGDSMSFEEGCRTYAEEQQQYEDEGYVDY